MQSFLCWRQRPEFFSCHPIGHAVHCTRYASRRHFGGEFFHAYRFHQAFVVRTPDTTGSTMSATIKPIRMNKQNASKYIDVSPRQFQRLVAAGKIRYVNDPGGRRMYPTAELDAYVERQMSEQWKAGAA
jgi:excisionase family DNA binding protein